MSLAVTGSQEETLVAFGAANSCSTGFGYAPAPQGRLRWRLEKIHGARVTLIDEFRTSQVCNRCHEQLKVPLAGHYEWDIERCPRLEKLRDSRRLQRSLRRGNTFWKKKLHGVRYCGTCRTAKGAPQFWHRDFNAARNILSCYLSVASSGIDLRPFEDKGSKYTAFRGRNQSEPREVLRTSYCGPSFSDGL